MRWGSRSVAAVGACAALAAGSGAARGQSVATDPSHGRVEGDVALVCGAGIVVAPRAPRAEAGLRVRYLESLGVFGSYEDAPVVGSASEPKRLFAAGLELRPIFIFRWLRGYETERARLDLALDSIGFELGAFFAQPMGAAFEREPGIQAGLGIEVPILPRPTGPWIGLHGGLRWSAGALASGVVQSVDDRSAYLVITLAWHQLIVAHVVDAGDEAPR